MPIALRTFVPAVATAVVVAFTMTCLTRTVAAQDTAPKTDAPPADSTTAAAPAEGADPKPFLEKGEAALKAGDFAGAMAAFNEAGKIAQQASQAGGGVDMLRAQSLAIVGRGRAETGLK